MTTEKDTVRAFTTEELDAVSGGLSLRLPQASPQLLVSSRFDWVVLNPQPLPPRLAFLRF